jgi:hypothetical protein
MSDTTIMPPVEPQPPEEQPPEEAPLVHLSFPKVTTIVLVALLAAAIGAVVAGTFLLGSAHGATGHAQAQYRASQSQLHATQGQLSTSQSSLSASQSALSAQQGATVVGTWTGTETNGWAGSETFNADHSYSMNGVDNGTVSNTTGTWSIVTPGTLLVVVTAANGSTYNAGTVYSYTVSGNTLTYTESDAPRQTTTETK